MFIKRLKTLHTTAFVSRTVLPCLAGLALLLLPQSASVQAQPHQRGSNDEAPTCLPRHLLKQLPTYDLNKNGRLDPDEHHAMRKAERTSDMMTFDTDQDGRLSKTEHDALRYAKMVKHFEELDLNRDAEISRAEATDSCTPIEHHFARIDADKSGSITWSEFENAAPKGPRDHGLRQKHER